MNGRQLVALRLWNIMLDLGRCGLDKVFAFRLECVDAVFEVPEVFDGGLLIALAVQFDLLPSSPYILERVEGEIKGGESITWRIVSLCMSPELQAGTMLLSVANSSFILLLLRLSMRLCAVFLAILRPAALDELGALRLVP